MISRLLREPLLQFLVLGAILFTIYSARGQARRRGAGKDCRFHYADRQPRRWIFRTWRRPPSKEELQNLIENYIRDEVFYRAGRAAGLDRDDVVIRRRVRQKMEFLAEEISVPEPSESELGSFLAANPDRFRTEDRLSFHHVFLSPTRRADTIDQDLKQVGDRNFRRRHPAVPRSLAIRSCSVRSFNTVSPRDVASTFGDGFARRIFSVEQGRWQGPSPRRSDSISFSSTDRSHGSVPPLDAVRAAVVREWTNARRSEAEQKLYRSLRDRYEITIEEEATQDYGRASMIRFWIWLSMLGGLLAEAGMFG